MSDPAAVFGLEPEDLDGHTVDALEDYLERGRTPVDLSIEESAACRLAMDALQRLHSIAQRYLEEDAAPRPEDQTWIEAVVAAIPFEVRPGRRFAVPSADPDTEAWITEAAIRGLIRAIGDDVDGLLVGSAALGHDDPVSLRISVAVVYGTVIQAAVDAFRSALLAELPRHVPFRVGAVDVHVAWVIDPARTGRG